LHFDVTLKVCNKAFARKLSPISYNFKK